MIEIWFVSTEHLTFSIMQLLLNKYPDSFQKEVKRYRQVDDQKRKLLGRELIRFYLKSRDCQITVQDIKFDQHKKPYFENGPFFNISHSGNYVVAAFSKTPVGIDIEEEKTVDVHSLSSFFHADELSFLKENNDHLTAFYKLWARKEAYLKATGTGLINGLDQFNAMDDVIEVWGKKWQIQEVSIAIGYQCAVCYDNAALQIKTKEMDLIEWVSALGS